MAESNDSKLGYEKVFVSLDGSKGQEKVLGRAIALAAIDGAELYVGHVVTDASDEDSQASAEKAFRASIADVLAKAEADPQIKKVQVMVGAGRIRETLKDDMLDVVKPDLVVCGARGLSSIGYASMGSISTFLTRKAPCDVLIVK
jgi:nucleotide-binding universal stress UspA family protein